MIPLPPKRLLEEEEESDEVDETEDTEDSDSIEDTVFSEETDFTEGRDWTEGSDLLDILVAEDLREVADVDLMVAGATATGTATATGAKEEVETGTVVCKRRVSRDFLATTVLGAAKARANAMRSVNLFILMLLVMVAL